ncbi:hypothetical protein [Micromonospora craniellae]|uniref:Uncharacterized protein n=2 Tax=Micromonospora craniellae TaxID=2294034 RepID=A0A372FSR5_9ACTN|nr:hypothetical protein [Micromonospora craniellae]QOC94376.1 hypothetical protein ID554_12755 [Micromonospora craniellae]RFS43748.1 hypothetical protein D0Q02_26090 [Micromonospora craniellae]
MLSFNAVHTLTESLLAVDARVDRLGWGRPSRLLLVHDRPAPAEPRCGRRQMRTVHLPLNPARLGRYRAGLADFLTDLTDALPAGRPPARPTLAACVDLHLITTLLTDPTPGVRLLAWALDYEDVLIEPHRLHEIRRIDAVDSDHRRYQVTRWRTEPHPTVDIDEHDTSQAIHAALATLVDTTRLDPRAPTTG